MDSRQYNFFIAGSNQALQFFQNVLAVSASNGAAGVGNNTIGAKLIAAILNLDKGACLLIQRLNGHPLVGMRLHHIRHHGALFPLHQGFQLPNNLLLVSGA